MSFPVGGADDQSLLIENDCILRSLVCAATTTTKCYVTEDPTLTGAAIFSPAAVGMLVGVLAAQVGVGQLNSVDAQLYSGQKVFVGASGQGAIGLFFDP